MVRPPKFFDWDATIPSQGVYSVNCRPKKLGWSKIFEFYTQIFKIAIFGQSGPKIRTAPFFAFEGVEVLKA